ncbi:hypothetical protein EV361DRAFT_950524 [Lentinula raphanica]|nr:hypothetical protein F5880DRAFT_1619577 [Lentinula raphanica]KAJ3970486.1 hypothetical protein EV361DRAFT_950524 [Lentinula raphanica]
MSRRKLIDNGLRTWDRSSEYANFRTNIHNNTFDKLSSMDPFYEAIFVGLLGTCIFALLFGAFVITGNIAAFAWIQIPRYVSELLARVLAPWAKAEELKRREEQIRLREMELDQLRTLQIDIDIQICERLAQFFERSAIAVRARAHEMENERELFADPTTQNRFEEI